MEVLEKEIDGQLIAVDFPIQDISLSAKTISFTDSSGKRSCIFSTSRKVREFLTWLTSNNSL
ncbi:MAG: hypothetical protein CMM76_17300 [Rhodospirillaceae bacterium]|nr:hypothetical protein [Rhodospirillaceae bacterium]|tara:strand:+ start:249 stop:434 length:186 start_codon:yes stop_codon:yes gene_type:complete